MRGGRGGGGGLKGRGCVGFAFAFEFTARV